MENLGPIRVLIAEDDPIHAILTQDAVALGGGEPVCVDNGLKAVDTFLNGSGIRLILMDVLMPIMSGLEATRAIRAQEEMHGLSHTFIVGLTASAMPHEIANCISCGMDKVITKPFSVLELVEVVRNSVRRFSIPPSESNEKSNATIV